MANRISLNVLGVPWVVAAVFATVVAGAAPLTATDRVLLTVTVVGSGTGTVTSDPAGISCPPACEGTFLEGSTVTLEAKGGADSELASWNGDECGGEGEECTLQMDGPRSVLVDLKSVDDPRTVLHYFLPKRDLAASPAAGLASYGGFYYGLSMSGGLFNSGTIFRVRKDGTDFEVLHSFSDPVNEPVETRGGALTLSRGVFYGVIAHEHRGFVFAISSNGVGYRVLHTFPSEPGDGVTPVGPLLLHGGRIYGTTSAGGQHDRGTVFVINPDGTGYRNLHSIQVHEGMAPGPLVESGGALFGTAAGSGGLAVFTLNVDGSDFRILHAFDGREGDPLTERGRLLALEGTLYGVSGLGGEHQEGAVFAVDTDGANPRLLHSFGGGPASVRFPTGELVASSTGVLYGATDSGGADDLGIVYALSTSGSLYRELRSFLRSDETGAWPAGGLVLDGDRLLGVTLLGGPKGGGSLFSMATNGRDSRCIWGFDSHVEIGDRQRPFGRVAVSGSELFGLATSGGGSAPTVYSIDTGRRRLRTLHTLPGNGLIYAPEASGCVTALEGMLYGVTTGHGSLEPATVWSLPAQGGALSVLHGFTAGDGFSPSGCLLAHGGWLYGTSRDDGPGRRGTVFRLSLDGSSLELLHSFEGSPSDGARPLGDLVEVGGRLNGMTRDGGSDGAGTLFEVDPATGACRVVRDLPRTPMDVGSPFGNLAVLDGTLFGLAEWGGPAGSTGTVWRINADGSDFVMLHSFPAPFHPGELVVDVGGMLFGTTWFGGPSMSPALYGLFTLRPDGSGYKELRYWEMEGAARVGFFFPEGLRADSEVARVYWIERDDWSYSPSWADLVVALDTRMRISGTVTLDGVGLAGVPVLGLPGVPRTDSAGRFEAEVPIGWSGTVTPALAGHSFTPSTIELTDLTTHRRGVDFAAMRVHPRPRRHLPGSAP